MKNEASEIVGKYRFKMACAHDNAVLGECQREIESIKPTVLVILLPAGVSRLLEGAPGMTFQVDQFTESTFGPVAHVRDYRFPENTETSITPYCIWTLAAREYRTVE